MKATYQEFKEYIPNLPWNKQELAEKLSIIGFETVLENDELNINLTANRRTDCTTAKMVAFDLAGVFDLPLENPPIFEAGKVINVTLKQVNKLLGANITPEEYKQIERLGFKVDENTVTCPSIRTDLETFADIAEEVIRLVGYNKLELKELSIQPVVVSNEYAKQFAIKLALVNTGLTEAISTSFTEQGSVEVKNPININERFMRPTLECGLLQVLARNTFLKRAAFFELGNVFNPKQQFKLGIILAGYKDPSIWAERIMDQGLDNSLQFNPVDADKLIKYNVKQGKVFYAEVDLSELDMDGNNIAESEKFALSKITEISKFPPLVRDFSITIINENVQDIVDKCKQEMPEILFGEIVDLFSIPNSKEWSVTLRFILQKMNCSYTEEEISVTNQKLADLLMSYQKR